MAMDNPCREHNFTSCGNLQYETPRRFNRDIIGQNEVRPFLLNPRNVEGIPSRLCFATFELFLANSLYQTLKFHHMLGQPF